MKTILKYLIALTILLSVGFTAQAQTTTAKKKVEEKEQNVRSKKDNRGAAKKSKNSTAKPALNNIRYSEGGAATAGKEKGKEKQTSPNDDKMGNFQMQRLMSAKAADSKVKSKETKNSKSAGKSQHPPVKLQKAVGKKNIPKGKKVKDN